eukprot:TRINITY_DN2999_c0_g1_i1.p1 TRINITY_DN2999_c0_g1~~TRINITY_DN2999_c0_g1_i1.p1  ORF type:complete len:216 (-),score=34.04 TRINITY_DN2999_c0_g1_i1:13-660(-)
MQFEFNWPSSQEYSESMRKELESMFNNVPKPEIMKNSLGKIFVKSFKFGKNAPIIKWTDISDFSYDKDTPFNINNTEMKIHLNYDSDFEIGIQTTLQFNFCSLESEEDIETFGLVSAHKKFDIPISFNVTDIIFDANMKLIYGKNGINLKISESPVKNIKVTTSIHHLGLHFLSDRLESVIKSTVNQFFVNQLPILVTKAMTPPKNTTETKKEKK